MADTNNEYFNIGSIVNCKTCFNEEIQGEVLAFDQHVKILTLSILLLCKIFLTIINSGCS